MSAVGERTTEAAPAAEPEREPDARPVETTTGTVLALQRAAGNAAVARLVAGGRGGAAAGDRRRRLLRDTTVPAAPKVTPQSSWWAHPPKSSNPDELFDALDDAVSLWAEHTTGLWAVLLIYDGRLHLYDESQQPFGVFALDPGATLPGEGFYIAAKTPDGTNWSTRRLLNMPAGLAWVPWSYTGRESFLSVELLVAPADRKEFLASMGDKVDHIAFVMVAGKGAGSGDRARAQTKRIRAKIAKEIDRRRGSKDAPPADPKAPKQDKPDPSKSKGDTAKGAGEKPPDPAEKKADTKDLPDTVAVVEDAKGVHIRITVAGARQNIDYRDGESDEQLMKRIQDATLKVRDEIDPSKSVRVEGSGAEAKIDQTPGGGGVKLPDGFPVTPGALAPNADAYPAKITSHGPDGNSPQPKGREDTVLGGTIDFTMQLDYAALSYGMQDEVFNRMQPIAYRWELIDITDIPPEKLAEKAKGQGVKTDSGIARDLGRSLSNTWEDTANDVTEHPLNTAYLQVVAISDLIQIGGALISSFFSLISQPLEDRSIAFNKKGVFLVRCFAQPVVSDDDVQRIIEHGRKPIIRAPSSAIYPVTVDEINRRAKEINDADTAQIDQLQKLVDNPPFPLTSDDIRKQLADATAFLQENATESLDHQVRNADAELARIRQWRELDQKATALDDRTDELRLWHAQLDVQGIEIGAYESQLLDLKKQLAQARTRYTGFGLREIKTDGRAVKPRMTLVSEVDGQTYSIVANLYETKASSEKRRVWRLADVTSDQTQDKYEGFGGTHTEAIQAAFDSFRDNSGYGRGSLAVRLPVEQLRAITGETVTLREEVMRVRPGDEARALMRLKDLATAAEIASLVVSGPLGIAIGAIGAIAGGIVAAENLRRRAGAERLKGDFQTAMDVIGVVGAVVAVGGLAAKGIQTAGKAAQAASEAEAASAGISAADRAAAIQKAATMQAIAKRAVVVGEYIHVAGQGLMKGQWIIIPVALAKELSDIDAEEAGQRSPSAGKFRAKRLEAWAKALKSGLVQVRMMQMASDPSAGWDPFRTNGKPPPAPRTGTPSEPPPPPPPTDVPASGGGRGPSRPTTPADQPTLHAPERPVDASAPSSFAESIARALGREHTPTPDRIKLVDPSLVEVLWDHAQAKRGGSGPTRTKAPTAIYDPDAGHVYVARDAFLASPELQQAAFDGVMRHMNQRGRVALGEPVARAVGELVMQASISGAPELSVSTPEVRALQQRIARLVGPEMVDRLLYGGEVAAFRSKLAEMLGSARGNALESALRHGDVRMAARLAGEPNPAMSNYFGELLAVSTSEMLARQQGGRPVNALRAALAEQVSRMVGQDLVEGALFRGRTDELRAALERRLGPEGLDRFLDALRRGDLAASQKALSEPQAPGGARRTAPLPLPEPRRPADPERTPQTGDRQGGAADEPGTTGERASPAPPPPPAAPLGVRAGMLRDALARGESAPAVYELALDTIAETGSFKDLRRQVSERSFGAAPPEQVSSALQGARQRLLAEVQAEVAAAIKAKYPGVEVRFVNMGTPGFNSDMDFTVDVRPGRASVNDAIAASVEGVRATYDALNGGRENVGDGFDGARAKLGGRRFPPDRVLDSNFYTELHEDAITPGSPRERLAIVEDQSVVSLVEARMNMHGEDWPAYRERLLDSFRDTGADYQGVERDINDLARQRLTRQLDAAEQLYNDLHPAGRTPDQVLAEVQQQLLDALRSGAPPRDIRALQAKIKLLEPDAYGTRAAKVGVVDQYQGAARAQSRKAAWDALGSGSDQSLSARERAATAAQEGAASAAKLRHAAPDVGASTSQAISAAKYLARVVEAFRRAGLTLQSPLIDRTGAVIGAKQEANAGPAAMGELKRWAQDTGRYGLDDQQVRDAFVQEAKELGGEMDRRLRVNESVAAGMSPTDAELDALAAQRAATRKPPPSGSGGTPPPGAPGDQGGAPQPRPTPQGPGPTQPATSPPPPAAGPAGFASTAQVETAVVDALGKLKTSMEPGQTPPNYDQAMAALEAGRTPIHRQLTRLVPIVERGLRTPELYGKVLADAWERAVLSGTDINGGLLELAREAGFTTRTVKAAKSNQDFFRENVSKKYLMVDEGVGDEHGIYSHLLQDLVADRALRAAGRSERAGDFRALLGRLKGGAPGYSIPLGDLLWRVTYDVEGEGHINEPESLRETLRPLGFK